MIALFALKRFNVMYSQKTIQDLKPEWYMILSSKDKLKIQEELRKERAEKWGNKPPKIKSGTKVTAKKTTDSITEGREYTVISHFATLVTTIYSSEWRQFITFKNKYGWTVKMNLRKFNLPAV